MTNDANNLIGAVSPQPGGKGNEIKWPAVRTCVFCNAVVLEPGEIFNQDNNMTGQSSSTPFGAIFLCAILHLRIGIISVQA